MMRRDIERHGDRLEVIEARAKRLPAAELLAKRLERDSTCPDFHSILIVNRLVELGLRVEPGLSRCETLRHVQPGMLDRLVRVVLSRLHEAPSVSRNWSGLVRIEGCAVHLPKRLGEPAVNRFVECMTPAPSPVTQRVTESIWQADPAALACQGCALRLPDMLEGECGVDQHPKILIALDRRQEPFRIVGALVGDLRHDLHEVRRPHRRRYHRRPSLTP